MQIFFYLPERYLPSPDRLASWTSGRIPGLLAGGKAASAQSWIYQTWAEIRHACQVELVTQLPNEGVIVTLSNLLHQGFRAGPGRFVVAVAADFLPHPGAQVQILQNPAHAHRLPGTIFVPHWPQPNLVPRNPSRGLVVETAAFFGDPSNLAREISCAGFRERLMREVGVRLEIREASRWHDFSDVDVAIAIRDFSRARHLGKPATKLYNAWLAGVPLIAGSDSAFSVEGKPGIDYLITRSSGELLRQIRALKENPTTWQAIANAGKTKSVARSRDAVRDIWRNLCDSEIPSRFEAWKKKTPLQQTTLQLAKQGLYFLDRTFRS